MIISKPKYTILLIYFSGIHLSTVKSLNGLGQSLLGLQRPEEAVEALKEAAEMGKEVFGIVQVEYTKGEIYVYLAQAYRDIGDYDNSEHWYCMAKESLLTTQKQFMDRGEDFNVQYTQRLLDKIP